MLRGGIEANPKDDDGVPLEHNDYITFTFGIPPTCVTALVTKGHTGWGVECLHPADVKPKRTTLKALTRHYQIWKARKQHVSAIRRAMGAARKGEISND